MITGAHILIYSQDSEADRVFFRDVLGFPSVDAGRGWLIFGLPPAEAALHPATEKSAPNQAGQGIMSSELYLMCDDLQAVIQTLASKGVSCAPATDAPWGNKTTIKLPSGGELGLYQPKHPTALGLGSR